MKDDKYGAARRRQDSVPPPHPAVIEKRRDGRVPVRTLLLLAVAGLLLFYAGSTIGRHTGPDYQTSRMKGIATVEKCERRGPLTLLGGFGHYDACYVWVQWDRGEAERVLIEDPGFFRGERPGDTIRIGYGIARPEIGYQPVLEVLRYVLGGIGGAMVLLAVLGTASRVMESRKR
ncbi:DUF6346 domain-containing protein [Actinoplanes sp. NPDC049802]|uniref:DUF6346 domain-containing protein n=1 Tax=Actinoplanes sp. NPDC049802 TaxID=3154742 RepID=UPI0033F33F92